MLFKEKAVTGERAQRPVLLPTDEHLLIEKVHKQSLYNGVCESLSQIRYEYLMVE